MKIYQNIYFLCCIKISYLFFYSRSFPYYFSINFSCNNFFSPQSIQYQKQEKIQQQKYKNFQFNDLQRKEGKKTFFVQKIPKVFHRKYCMLFYNFHILFFLLSNLFWPRKNCSTYYGKNPIAKTATTKKYFFFCFESFFFPLY